MNLDALVAGLPPKPFACGKWRGADEVCTLAKEHEGEHEFIRVRRISKNAYIPVLPPDYFDTVQFRVNK